jgi:membrane-bound lytic murein transglycosylase B
VARDGDGDGFADIWTNKADTLASIANYFRDAGWRTGQPWGCAPRCPTVLTGPPIRADHIAQLSARPRSPRPLAHGGEWRRMGVIAQGPSVTMFLPA